MKVVQEMKLMELGGENPRATFLVDDHSPDSYVEFRSYNVDIAEIEAMGNHLYKRFRVTTTFEVIESEAK